MKLIFPKIEFVDEIPYSVRMGIYRQQYRILSGAIDCAGHPPTIYIIKIQSKWRMFRTLRHELWHWLIYLLGDNTKLQKLVDRKLFKRPK